MRSPFKFLDAYTLKDRDVFFGRKQEMEALYDMVYQTPLMLLYGLSGTGKTSLIQCGLASQFDGPDWYPFYIRKQDDINQSLRQALSRPLRKPVNENLPQAVNDIFRTYLRPVYLIFDQFEELFILGTPEEQEQFLKDIQDLLQHQLPCKIILVMREEYIGQLYDFERVIPSVFDFRLRVEPMSASKVKEVMAASFAKFNITLEGSNEDRLNEMIENISGERARIELPYLQVYLDMLYRDDYRRTYGQSPIKGPLPPLTFTESEIRDIGRIDDVMDKFLTEQTSSLQKDLKNQFKTIPEQTVAHVLDKFVTEEATKQPIYYSREGEVIQIKGNIKDLFPPIKDDALTACLDALQQRRILRFGDDSIELAHDSLAKLIDQKRTDDQRQLNDISKRIKQNYAEHLQTGDFLREKQLTLYDDYLPLIKLDQSVLIFIENSRQNVAEQKVEEQRQQRQKVELEQERKNARRFKILNWLIGALAIIAVISGVWALYQWGVANDRNVELKRAGLAKLINTAKSHKVGGSYPLAFNELNLAKSYLQNEFDSNSNLPDSLNLSYIEALNNRWLQLQQWVSEGDAAFNDDSTLVLSLKAYQKAYNLEQDSVIQLKIQRTEDKIDTRFQYWMERVERFCELKEKKEYLKSLTYAEALAEGDSSKTEQLNNLKCPDFE